MMTDKEFEDEATNPGSGRRRFDVDEHLVLAVLLALQQRGSSSFWEVAYELDELPWDVLEACYDLSHAGKSAR